MTTFQLIKQKHPCFSDSLGVYGRIHLPVSPACNLCCRYCERTFSKTLERPGRSRGILPLDKVSESLKKAMGLCPELTTVGIAGPGDTLASHHALEAFRIVDQDFPGFIKCMSTNGLLLNEKAEEIAAVHVDSVTVTVNAVEPEIEEQINNQIWYHGAWIQGREAAKILIANQLEGIKRAAELGITVKINTVLIPGINDTQIEHIAKKTAQAGARIFNIIPLIPQAEMQDFKCPDCKEIDRARFEAGKYLDVFQHCQHCRADAVGKLGKEDFGKQIYGDLELEPENFSHG